MISDPVPVNPITRAAQSCLRKNINKLTRLPFKRKKEFNNEECSFKYGEKAFFMALQTRIESVYFRTLNRVLRLKYRKKKHIHVRHTF